MNPDSLADALTKLNIDNMVFPYTRGSITQAEISTIPVFGGEPNSLPLYIDACEDLVKTYANGQNLADPINPYLIKIIKSRLSGEAQALIGSRRLSTWHEIKTLLTLNFLDQRSEDCLLNDLTGESPKKNENPYSFGQRIKDTLNLLLTKMQLEATAELIQLIPLKTTLYKNTALQTYKRGLMKYGNIGELLYIKNPQTLETAMSDVLEYQNWQYRCGKTPAPETQHKTANQIIPGQMKMLLSPQQQPIIQQPVFRQQQFYQQPRPVFQQPQPFHQIQRLYQPQQYYQPQQFYQQRPQQNQQKPPSFKFNKSPGQLMERKQQKQRPMDIDPSSSRVKVVKQTPFGPSYPQKKWIAEEIHLQEQELTQQINDDECQYPDQYLEWTENPAEELELVNETEDYQQDQNFCQLASTDKPPPLN